MSDDIRQPLSTIRDFIAWDLDDRGARGAACASPATRPADVPLLDVPICTHIGLRFTNQWSIAGALADLVQPDEAVGIYRLVIDSMNVELHG